MIKELSLRNHSFSFKRLQDGDLEMKIALPEDQVYSKKFIAAVRAKSDIVSVISDFTKLEGRDGKYQGVCPFDDSQEKSLIVSRDKQLFQCYECGASGDVISFVMQARDADFNQAIEYLAQRAQMQLPKPRESKIGKEERNSTLSINRDAAQYYWNNMKNPKSQQGMEYLEGRGLTQKTITRFGIGLARDESDGLYRYLKEKGYSDEQIKTSGLISFYQDKGYDKFRNRVMCPIISQNGEVLGFSGRVLDDSKPKYMNSPETLAFDKKRTLYGMNFAQNSRKEGIILCEGNLDVISLHQAGFDNAVASLGTAFTYEQAFMVKAKTDHVYLIFDSDEAGVKAAQRAIPIMKAAGLDVQVVSMAPYKDPDEFIKAEGTSAFQARLDAAESSYQFEIHNQFANWSSSSEEGQKEIALAFAQKMLNTPVDERELYMSSLQDFLNSQNSEISTVFEIRPKEPKESLPHDDFSEAPLQQEEAYVDISSIMEEYEVI